MFYVYVIKPTPCGTRVKQEPVGAAYHDFVDAEWHAIQGALFGKRPEAYAVKTWHHDSKSMINLAVFAPGHSSDWHNWGAREKV